MPSDQTCNISLEAELNPFICGQMASGPSPNANEVVRAGLRLLIQTRRDLEVNFPPNRRGRDGR
jgi:Arc/MetJ-type ribon-helix-helix transcriptional regulator